MLKVDEIQNGVVIDHITAGTGLGLYISQAVVHGNFGGNLWHEDNPEGGAIFGMSIPLERTKSSTGISIGGVNA